MMWLCRLLGHKYIKSKGGYWHRSGYCFRCGKSPERTNGQ